MINASHIGLAAENSWGRVVVVESVDEDKFTSTDGHEYWCAGWKPTPKMKEMLRKNSEEG